MTLDLSTQSTGWAIFDADQRLLLNQGAIKGKPFGKEKNKLRNTFMRLKYMAQEVRNLVDTVEPTLIVIEEIAGSRNRLSQKTLDCLHFAVWEALEPHLEKVEYYDVSGKDGWRFHLRMRLTDEDKVANEEARSLNKVISSKSKKLGIIGPKDLAIRYVNQVFKLGLDQEASGSHRDIADAVAMGDAYLKVRSRK